MMGKKTDTEMHSSRLKQFPNRRMAFEMVIIYFHPKQPEWKQNTIQINSPIRMYKEHLSVHFFLAFPTKNEWFP